MEPVTTLAVAGISWIASTAMGGIAEGAADRTFLMAVRGIRARLPALAARPEGSDLARGLRQAQLCALQQVILDYREQRPLARFGGGSDAFSEQALDFCRSARTEPVQPVDVAGETLLPLAGLDGDIDSVAAGAAVMEAAVLGELANALNELSIPTAFVTHFRNGSRGAPRFLDLFRTFFVEQVRNNNAFREVLHIGLLLQNSANLANLGDWLVRVETRVGGALARVESGVADLAAKNEAWYAAMMELVKAEKGVPTPALRDILEKLGETAVEDEDLLARLSAKADEYLALSEQLSIPISAAPQANIVLAEGKKLLDVGDLDGARRLFADGHVALRPTREQHARDEAALLAAEAGVDRLQLRYRDAAERYKEAERLVVWFDPDARFDYLCRRAGTLQQLGYEFWDNAALGEAVSLWRLAVQLRPRSVSPLEWAMCQNNLGKSLWSLGERESDSALLEEALVVVRAALEERTRERVLLDWADTQGNLGATLSSLGFYGSDPERIKEALATYSVALEQLPREQFPLDWAKFQVSVGRALGLLGVMENTTAWLEDAVAASRAALEELTRERVPLVWALTQYNVAILLVDLGERENDTARLEEAVATFLAALEERTRERVPRAWAKTQISLGNALQALGQRESGTARLEEAVAAFRAALQEHSREREPLDWATIQYKLGTALQTLGARESGTARLEEAVAAYHNALEKFTRERRPLHWAMT
ncbi:MAG TPA: tetratricopeptide repeat protein, partial [Longimicrobium sp.]|nr:tetratricopeptide repeat protein [Longimicrobium sp.]